jgi:hypothetical protein
MKTEKNMRKGTGGPVIQPDFHVSYPDIFNRCGGLDRRNY